MKRILLFVHYNKKGRLEERVVHTLKKIKHLYSTVVVISNSTLSPKDKLTIESVSDHIITRDNIGFDFAAWRDGMEDIGWSKLKKYDSLTLMNDTCYFPVWPIDGYFEGFDAKKEIDFWGASIYRDTPYGMPETNGSVPEHIQSYFMTFKKTVTTSRSFIEFWKNIKNHSDVNHVIRDYETKLTKILKDDGYKYDAIINNNNPIFSSQSMINPIFQDPLQLLSQRFPFIKLKAVNKFNIVKIKDYIKKFSNYNPRFVNAYGKDRLVQPFLRFFNFLIKKAHFSFLAISIPAVIAFAIITPPGFGGDEMSHAIRAYTISKGHLFTVNDHVPKNLKNTVELGWDIAENSPWGKSFYNRSDLSVSDLELLNSLGNKNIDPSETSLVKFNNTDPYPPIVYLGAATGFIIGESLNLSVGLTIAIARILNSIPFFILGALAIYLLRKNMARWLLFTVLLLPTVLSYAGTINGDPYNIASVALFFALFIVNAGSKERMSKRNIALISVSAFLLSFAKLPSVLLTGLLFFIKKERFNSRRAKLLIISSIVAISLITSFASLKTGFTDVLGKSASTEKISWSISHPIETATLIGRTIVVESPDYLNRAVGVMGRNGVYIHGVIILVIYTWLMIIALSLSDMSKKRGLLVLTYSALMHMAVIGLLYIGDPKNSPSDWVIFGIHGKYFTPFMLLTFYGIGAILPFKISSNKNYIEILTVFLMALITLVSILLYMLALY